MRVKAGEYVDTMTGVGVVKDRHAETWLIYSSKSKFVASRDTLKEAKHFGDFKAPAKAARKAAPKKKAPKLIVRKGNLEPTPEFKHRTISDDWSPSW